MTRTERRWLWMMAGPFLVGVVVLVAGPAILTIVMAFFRWDLVSSPEFVGFANFDGLADDEIFRTSLRNSLAFVAVAVPLRLIVAVGLALALQRRGRAATGAVLAPSVVPEAALALAWLWIFNPLYGPLNLLLEALGLPTPSWLTQPGPARWAVILMSLFTIGEAFLLASVARRSIPRELYDLATEQGARAWGRLLRVTVPMLAPVLLLIRRPGRRAQPPGDLHPRPARHRGRSAAVLDDLPAPLCLPDRVRVPALRHGVGGHAVGPALDRVGPLAPAADRAPVARAVDRPGHAGGRMNDGAGRAASLASTSHRNRPSAPGSTSNVARLFADHVRTAATPSRSSSWRCCAASWCGTTPSIPEGDGARPAGSRRGRRWSPRSGARGRQSCRCQIARP